MTKMTNVPFVDMPAQHDLLRKEILTAVGRVLDHGQFVFGEEVAEFEKNFAGLCECPFAIGVNSGLDALILGLRALDISAGDEVITPPNSYIASSGAIGLVGAKPVFVDVGADYNIDPELIEAAITRNTKAIMPVHLTGRPCEMDMIRCIAENHGLFIIEDAAQAVTARYKDCPTGSMSDIGCFSLHPLKTLNACGDAGIMTLHDPNLYDRLLGLRNHGLRNRDECAEWGYNSRLDTIQAAILNIKIRHVREWTETRREHAKRYQDALCGIEGLGLPTDRTHEYAAYHTFIICTTNRDELKNFLNDKGIGAGVHYPIPIHLQEPAAGLGYKRGDMPATERQADEILSLPVQQNLTETEIDFVINAIKEFFSHQ